ncbi:hypothetical protein TrVGV298_007448 [Trichoderma virens]|nr:hypothetical protein TrVGV298_007448 [Trichoderma virens]
MGAEKTLTEETSIPEDAHQQAKSRATYASFGDGRVTATANAYGHLLQITRYAEEEPSCFVCVDLEETPPPSSITERMVTLQSNIGRDDMGMRLIIEDYSGRDAWEVKKTIPKMTFHHDRWPCFIRETTYFDQVIEYFVNGDTVYQIYTYTPNPTVKERPIFPNLSINDKMLIRDLDFLKSRNPQETNNSTQNDSLQETSDGYVIKKQKSNQNTESNVVLSIKSFINGIQQPIRGNRIYPLKKMDDYLQENGAVQITLAYTLEIPRNNDDNITTSSSPQGGETLKQIVGIPLNTPFSIPSFTTDKHLNFTLRRNLEHILSVCSIPIDNPPAKVPPITDGVTIDHPPAEVPPITDGIAVDELLDKVPYIALTCGDISGHRISTAASLYVPQRS